MVKLRIAVVLDRSPSAFRLLQTLDGEYTVAQSRLVRGLYCLLKSLAKSVFNENDSVCLSVLMGSEVAIHNYSITSRSSLEPLLSLLDRRLLKIERLPGDGVGGLAKDWLQAGSIALSCMSARSHADNHLRHLVFFTNCAASSMHNARDESLVVLQQSLVGIDRLSMIVDRLEDGISGKLADEVPFGTVGGVAQLELLFEIFSLEDLLYQVDDTAINWIASSPLTTAATTFSGPIITVRFAEFTLSCVSLMRFVDFKNQQGFRSLAKWEAEIDKSICPGLSQAWNRLISITYRIQGDPNDSYRLLVELDVNLPPLLAAQLLETMKTDKEVAKEQLGYERETIRRLFRDLEIYKHQDEQFTCLYRGPDEPHDKTFAILPYSDLLKTLKFIRPTVELYFTSDEIGLFGKFRAWLRKDLGYQDYFQTQNISLVQRLVPKKCRDLIMLDELFAGVISFKIFDLALAEPTPAASPSPHENIVEDLKKRFKLSLLPHPFPVMLHECILNGEEKARVFFSKASKRWRFSNKRLADVTFDAFVKLRQSQEFISIRSDIGTALFYYKSDSNRAGLLSRLKWSESDNSVQSELWWTPQFLKQDDSEEDLTNFIKKVISGDLRIATRSKTFENACKVCSAKSKADLHVHVSDLFNLTTVANFSALVTNHFSMETLNNQNLANNPAILRAATTFETCLKQQLFSLHDLEVECIDGSSEIGFDLKYFEKDHGFCWYPTGSLYLKLLVNGGDDGDILLLTTLSSLQSATKATVDSTAISNESTKMKMAVCTFWLSASSLKQTCSNKAEMKIVPVDSESCFYNSVVDNFEAPALISSSIVEQYRRALLKALYQQLLLCEQTNMSIGHLVAESCLSVDFSLDFRDFCSARNITLSKSDTSKLVMETSNALTSIVNHYFCPILEDPDLKHLKESPEKNDALIYPIFLRMKLIDQSNSKCIKPEEIFSSFETTPVAAISERINWCLKVSFLVDPKESQQQELPPEKHYIIREMLSQMEKIIKDATMKLLLYAELSSEIIESVAKYLEPAFPRTVEMRLIRPTKCLDYVKQTLEKGFLGDYSIRKAGIYYVITGEKSASVVEPSGGLGISVDSLGIIEQPKCLINAGFWLFFHIENESVKIFYFAEDFAIDRIGYLIQKLRSLCERSNRYILLHEMHDSRYCSKYLIARDAASVADREGDSDEEVPSDEILQSFKPGEFECPLVGRWTFPIFWRFRPLQALNAFSANILHPLAVANRKNIFVYAQGDAVFYMRLHEEHGGNTREDTVPLSSGTTTYIEYSPLIDSPASVVSGGDRIYGSPSIKVSSARSSDQNQLILEVYGIDVPGKEMTSDFVNMIEAKLNGLTTNLISTILARNPNLRLTMPDLEFISGSSSLIAGALSSSLPIRLQFPGGFKPVFQALNYFRQNACLFLIPCYGPEAAQFIRSRLDDNLSTKSESTNSLSFEIPITEFSFIYSSSNAPTRTPSSPSSFDFGPGVGAVILNVYGANEELFSEINISGDSICHLSGFVSGTINTEGLKERLQMAFNCALKECTLEKSLLQASSGSEMITTKIQGIESLLLGLSDNRSPLTAKIELAAVVRPWQVDHVLCLCKDLLSGHFNFLHTELSFRDNGNNPLKLSLNRTIFDGNTTHRSLKQSKAFNVVLFATDRIGESQFPGEDDFLRFVIDAGQNLSAKSPEESMLLAPLAVCLKENNQQIRVDLPRSMALFGSYDASMCKIRFTAYNFSQTAVDLINSAFKRLSYWLEARSYLLENALLQKMGIFNRPAFDPRIPEENLLNNVALRPFDSAAIPDDIPIYGGEKKWSNMDFSYLLRELKASAIPPFVRNRFSPHLAVLHDAIVLWKHSRSEQQRLKVLGQKWTAFDGQSEAETAQTSIDVTELAIFLRKARLIHWCRTPLLFSTIRDRLFLLSGGSYICTYPDLSVPFRLRSKSNTARTAIASSKPDDEEMRRWFRCMIDTFMDEYVGYLKGLGMKVVLAGCSRIITKAIADIEKQPSVIPTFSISSDLDLDAPVVYMQKTFGNRVTLMLEIKIQDMFVSVNLYTVDLSGLGGLRKSSNGTEPIGPITQFTEESSAFRNLIHLNSFVYDFHLRYLVNVMSSSRLAVHWLDLLDILKAFVRYNVTPANYARNSIQYGLYKERCEIGSEDLFKYIALGNQPYSINPLVFEGHTTGCFVLSLSEDFEEATLEDNLDPHYSLILFPSGDHSSSDRELNEPEDPRRDKLLSIGYFVLRTYQSNPFPQMASKNPQAHAPSKFVAGSSIQSLSMSRLVDKALLAVQKIVEQAVINYGRDSLWRRLIASTKSAPTSSNEFTLVDFQILSSRYHTQPVTAIDQDLAQVFSIKEFDWSFALDELKERYHWVAQEFRERRKLRDNPSDEHEGFRIRHLTLLNPQNSDLLIHFALNCDCNELEVNAVSREVRETDRRRKNNQDAANAYSGTPIELEFLSDIARTVAYLMFSQI